MEYNFTDICLRISQHFADLAAAYEKDNQLIKAQLDFHAKEIANNNETKRKILAALQEDVNGI